MCECMYALNLQYVGLYVFMSIYTWLLYITTRNDEHIYACTHLCMYTSISVTDIYVYDKQYVSLFSQIHFLTFSQIHFLTTYVLSSHY